MKKKIIQNENGFALLFAMLALLLLASIGLAMVYAADTETSIDSNYKDQTKAQYAAYSALSEATDRIRQGCGTSSTCFAIPWPSDIPTPSGTNANIIYIINPKTNEVVSPWLSTNKYYDTEICDTNNENMPNSFCASRPTSAGNYTIYCNGAAADCSASTSGGTYNVLTTTINTPWQRAVPLDYKWVRINLKSEQMLPGYPINTTTTTNGVACWDGHGQLAPGGGYNANCTPNGGLTISATGLTGTGWTGAPTINLGPPDIGGGVQASYQLTTSSIPNTLINPVVTSAGTGYGSAPVVTLTGGGPTTAGTMSATIVPIGAPITAVALATGVSGSATSPCWSGTSTTIPASSVLISAPTGTGGTTATATGTFTGAACVAVVNVSGNCNGANYHGTVASPTVYTGITLDPGASGNTGTGMTMTFSFTDNTGTPHVTVTAGGTGYTTSSGWKIKTDSNITTGCSNALTANVSIGQQISSVALNTTVGAGGSGYLGTPAPGTCTAVCPTLSFGTAPNVGSIPTGTFTMGTASPLALQGTIQSLNIVTAGSGYASAPTVTIAAPGGVGTTATGTVSITTNSIALAVPGTYNSGSGYSTAPTCTITGGGLVGTYNCSDGSANGLVVTVNSGATTYYGQVAEVTAFAQTSNFGNRFGSKYTSQMELASSVRLPAKFNVGGAITLAGPAVVYNPPNSLPYVVNGADAGGCGNPPGTAKPAIGVIDDPSNPQGLAADVIGDINGPGGKPANFTGAGPAPDVENAFSALGGSPTPATLDALLAVLRAETQPANHYGSAGSFGSFSAITNLNPTGSPPINFVDGDLSLSGNFTGSGILVVTGNLAWSGDYHWNGLVLVIGKGVADLGGGGNGQIVGSLYVAQIYDSTTAAMLTQLGTSTLTNSGGGGNGVQYNSCYVDSYLTQLPKIAPDPSPLPAKVLSVRTVTSQ